MIRSLNLGRLLRAAASPARWQADVVHIDHADGRDTFVSELTLLLDTGGIRHLSATRSAVMRAATRLTGTDLDRQGRVISTVGHLTVPAFG